MDQALPLATYILERRVTDILHSPQWRVQRVKECPKAIGRKWRCGLAELDCPPHSVVLSSTLWICGHQVLQWECTH